MPVFASRTPHNTLASFCFSSGLLLDVHYTGPCSIQAILADPSAFAAASGGGDGGGGDAPAAAAPVEEEEEEEIDMGGGMSMFGAEEGDGDY